MHIQDKVFMVSGAASGLGAATARMLARAGARLMLVDLNAEALKAQASELEAGYAVADITQADAAQAAVDMAMGSFGELHGLVNCAGVVAGARRVLSAGVVAGATWPAGVAVPGVAEAGRPVALPGWLPWLRSCWSIWSVLPRRLVAASSRIARVVRSVRWAPISVSYWRSAFWAAATAFASCCSRVRAAVRDSSSCVSESWARTASCSMRTTWFSLRACRR